MDRKKFLKAGILGAAGAALTPSVLKAAAKEGKLEIRKNEQVGFNHLPPEGEDVKRIDGMKTVLHRAHTRGHADHGWLNTHHTFSFANYYNPNRMNFGALRVLNDDIVAGGKGFGTHPHKDMEIISVPLSGALEHKDSMGNKHTIQNGDIQVMSAGTGIRHSEYNKNRDQDVRFLQIWVFPTHKNLQPRYDQIKRSPVYNGFEQILSPNPEDSGVWINQQAWFHLGKFTKEKTENYSFKRKGNGLYVFVLEGSVEVGSVTLGKRDGMGVWETGALTLKPQAGSEVLLMEVPMV